MKAHTDNKQRAVYAPKPFEPAAELALILADIEAHIWMLAADDRIGPYTRRFPYNEERIIVQYAHRQGEAASYRAQPHSKKTGAGGAMYKYTLPEAVFELYVDYAATNLAYGGKSTDRAQHILGAVAASFNEAFDVIHDYTHDYAHHQGSTSNYSRWLYAAHKRI